MTRSGPQLDSPRAGLVGAARKGTPKGGELWVGCVCVCVCARARSLSLPLYRPRVQVTGAELLALLPALVAALPASDHAPASRETASERERAAGKTSDGVSAVKFKDSEGRRELFFIMGDSRVSL